MSRPVFSAIAVSDAVTKANEEAFNCLTSARPHLVGVDTAAIASGVIIPRKGLAELKRLVDEDDAEEVELAFEGNNGLARKGSVTLLMRLIEGEFPDYRQVIPKELPQRLTIATEPLSHAIRRVALLSAERSRAVKFEFSAGRLVISSNNPDLGEAQEELDVDYSGDDLSIAFNARYMMDALTAAQSKEIELGLRDELSPVRICPAASEDSLAVVMPMRL